MEETLKEILKRLDELNDRIVTIQETMATSEEVKSVANTLELIATGEVAAARTGLEDKIETGDILNKILIDGLENRLTEKMEEGFNRLTETMEEGFDRISQAISVLANNQNQISEVMKVFLERFEAQDEVISLFDQRLKMQEQATHNLRKAIKKLGGDVS